MSEPLPIFLNFYKVLGRSPLDSVADLCREPVPAALRKALKRPKPDSVDDLYLKLLLYGSVHRNKTRAAGRGEKGIAIEAARKDVDAFNNYVLGKMYESDTKFHRRLNDAMALVERRKRTGQPGLSYTAKKLVALHVLYLLQKGDQFPRLAEFYHTVSEVVRVDYHSYLRILRQLGVKSLFPGERRGRPPIITSPNEERGRSAG